MLNGLHGLIAIEGENAAVYEEWTKLLCLNEAVPAADIQRMQTEFVYDKALNGSAAQSKDEIDKERADSPECRVRNGELFIPNAVNAGRPEYVVIVSQTDLNTAMESLVSQMKGQ